MLINTEQAYKDFIVKLKDEQEIVVDLETNGLHPYMGDRLIGIALYLPTLNQSAYIPFRHGEGINLDTELLVLLKPYLSDPSKHYYGWNVKFDQHFLTVDGFPILENRAIYSDVMICLHLLDENRYDPADTRGLNYKLKDNGRLFLGVEEGEAEDELKDYMKQRGIDSKGQMWKLDAELVYKYAEQDVILTWKLYQFFLPYLEKWNQVELFKEVAEFNSTILARMEYYGVPVDRDLIQRSIASSKEQAGKVLRELKNTFGESFNPNSSKQVPEALGTKNSRRVTLEQSNNPDALKIIDYKFLTKAEGTFYKPYLYYSAFDGKIHPTFNVTRTNSGRLSSSDPNLQQVPRESKVYKVKEVFVAPEGYKFVQMDYAQQELRLACHFSHQKNMTELFMKGQDLHCYTASMLFNVSMDEIGKESVERHIGKTANFAFLYGMGLIKAAVYISTQLKISLAVDRAFCEENKMRLFYSLFPGTQWEYFIAEYPSLEDALNDIWNKLFSKLGAYAVEVKDAQAYKRANPDCITIYETTRILDGWRELYDHFIQASKEACKIASTPRSPVGLDGTYKYYRLEDNRVRHFIKGQRPFTAWNFIVQGTGALIMRKALMKIDQAFPFIQDEVLPIISVHDSACFLIKDNENFQTNIDKLVRIMEDFEYYPPQIVDVKIGQNWGNLE